MSFEDDVIRVLSRIPRGTILTYGEVAEESRHQGASRAVGNVLSRAKADVPWWRVVTANGRLVPGRERDQQHLLSAEGVSVMNGRVMMRPEARAPRGTS